MNAHSNKNCIFVFDLHNVLFKRAYIKTIGTIIKHIFLLWIVRPRIVFKTAHILLTKGSGEELITYIKNEYPQLAWSIPSIVAIANAQYLDNHMHQLLMNLKNRGYVLVIASNIGATFFEDLEKKNAEFFSLFSYIQIVKPQKTIIRKPMPAYFEQLKGVINIADKTIVFIDDNKKHIAGAKKAGFETIQFKNAKQLKKALQSYTRDSL